MTASNKIIQAALNSAVEEAQIESTMVEFLELLTAQKNVLSFKLARAQSLKRQLVEAGVLTVG